MSNGSTSLLLPTPLIVFSSCSVHLPSLQAGSGWLSRTQISETPGNASLIANCWDKVHTNAHRFFFFFLNSMKPLTKGWLWFNLERLSLWSTPASRCDHLSFRWIIFPHSLAGGRSRQCLLDVKNPPVTCSFWSCSCSFFFYLDFFLKPLLLLLCLFLMKHFLKFSSFLSKILSNLHPLNSRTAGPHEALCPWTHLGHLEAAGYTHMYAQLASQPQATFGMCMLS